MYVNHRSLAPVIVYVTASARTVLTGNIVKINNDHFEIPMILRSTFLINILPHNKRLGVHNPYTYNARALVQVGRHSKRTAWRYHID